MEVRVKIGENEAIVTVANADEAVSFLQKFSRGMEQGTETTKPECEPAAQITTTQAPTIDKPVALREALLHMQGKPSGKILKWLAESDGGCSDSILKRMVADSGEDFNLGPAFAHLSKSCKKFGLGKEEVIFRRSKRAPNGKMSYFYRITDEASRIISDIPKYDEPIEDDNLW